MDGHSSFMCVGCSFLKCVTETDLPENVKKTVSQFDETFTSSGSTSDNPQLLSCNVINSMLKVTKRHSHFKS